MLETLVRGHGYKAEEGTGGRIDKKDEEKGGRERERARIASRRIKSTGEKRNTGERNREKERVVEDNEDEKR